MTSYTLCIVFALFAMMMLVAVNSSDPSSQSELFSSNSYSKSDGDLGVDKRPSFFVGSRYGRSPQLYGTKARRLSVAPRNDRFFLGSRYGKRSNEYAIPAVYDQDTLASSSSTTSGSTGSIISNQSSDNNNNNNNNLYYKMSCTYTGYKNYFKCNSVNDNISNFIQQLSNDENLI